MVLLYIILSFLSGFSLGLLFFYRKPIEPRGVMRIDRSDPDDSPYLFLELKSKINDLKNGDIVSFEVNTESYISHD